jgi:hypothetical protein
MFEPFQKAAHIYHQAKLRLLPYHKYYLFELYLRNIQVYLIQHH